MSTVIGSLGYNGNPVGEHPYWGSPDSGRGCNIIDEPHDMPITDIKSLPTEEQQKFGLDTSGFAFIKHDSALKTFDDEEQVKSVYYKECEELYKQMTGATRIHIFDHTIRRAKWGGDSVDEGLGPAQRVHVDQSTWAAKQRVTENLGDEADKFLQGRFQIINLWRPLRGVVKDSPLAVGDFRSLDVEKDTVVSSVYYPNHSGESLSVRYNPNHKFYYMSDMTPEDVVLIKCFESEPVEGRALMTPHTGFAHPDAPKGWPHRESIEVRALLFYEE